MPESVHQLRENELSKVRTSLFSQNAYRNPMDVRTLETLKDQYPTSSWALWSPEFPDDGCVEEDSKQLFDFISERRDSLRPSVVLLSLNPSTHLPSTTKTSIPRTLSTGTTSSATTLWTPI